MIPTPFFVISPMFGKDFPESGKWGKVEGEIALGVIKEHRQSYWVGVAIAGTPINSSKTRSFPMKKNGAGKWELVGVPPSDPMYRFAPRSVGEATDRFIRDAALEVR